MDESQNPLSTPTPQGIGLKEQFTTVTPLSKFLTMALFVSLAFIGFLMGTMKGEQLSTGTPTPYAESPSATLAEGTQGTDQITTDIQIRNVDWNQYFDERFVSWTQECGDYDRHNFEIRETEYGDLNDDGTEDAVVKYFACWNGTGGESEVFTITEGGKPLKLFVSNGSPDKQTKLFEGAQGHEYFSINKEGKLQFKFPIYNESDSNCCPSGGEKTITYEWNKASQQFEIASTAVLPPETSLPEETITLGIPTAILAHDNQVALLLPMRECDKSYVIERSYNMTDWERVGTTSFPTYQEPYDHNFRACENNYVDSSVASGTKKLWYRYGLLDEQDNVTTWSDIGEVTMEEY